MSESKNQNLFFTKRLGSNRLLLCVIALLAAAVDTAVAVVAIVSGVGVMHFALPLAFAVLDVLLIPLIYNSNFRFRYSVIVPVLYTIFTIGLTAATLILVGAQLFTIPAAVLFLSVHVLSCVVLSMAAGTAVHQHPKNGARVRNVLFLLLFAATVLAYGASVAADGFYGQGSADTTRNAVFELSKDGKSYTVKSALSGSGERLTIPATFRGKPVRAVSGAVFADRSIKEVYLQGDKSVKFLADAAMNGMTARVYIDKAYLDDYKKSLVDASTSQDVFLVLCNQMAPSGLEENEVAITFTYGKEDVAYTDYKLIPTWYGKAGDVFSLADHADGVYYAEGYDPKNEGFLYKSYLNDSKVLAPLVSNGTEINGAKVTESLHGVRVSFETVYKIGVSEDNDSVYTMPDAFCAYGETGYRYVIRSTAQSMLAGAPAREGFTLSFEYESDKVERKALSDATELVQSATTTLYPIWTMHAPTVDKIGAGEPQGGFIYGNNVTLSVDATAAAEDFALSYRWDFANSPIAATRTHTLPNVVPAQSGTYTVVITASAPAITSLTAATTVSLPVQINKRTVDCVWTLPENTVYSGGVKAISTAVDVNDTINGDMVELVPNMNGARNVGDYSLSATISGAMAELYTISTETKQTSLKITPYVLNVSWGESDFIYDGSAHAPVASANGVGDEAGSALEIVVSGAKTNAGDNYSATASVTNSNYTIANAAKAFVITPRAISLIWDTTTTEFVYDGQEHGLSVSAVSGAVAGEEAAILAALRYDGRTKNAANVITMRATLPNTNYEVISGSTETFKISPKLLTVSWGANIQLTYNGAAQKPNATVTGAVGSDNIGLRYSSFANAIHVGDYAVTISISNSNYVLPANVTANYEIVAAPIDLTWVNTSLTYKGEAQMPTIGNIKGCVNATEREALRKVLIYAGKQTNVGNPYAASVSLPDGTDYYIREGATTQYSITPKRLTINWAATRSFVYDGKAHTVTATLLGVVSGDVVEITYTDCSANIGVGSYTVALSITNANYSLPTETTECAYSITPKSLKLTWDAERTFAYDGALHTVRATVDGVLSGDVVKISYSDNDGNVNAGIYTVRASIDNKNYALTGTTSCQYEITQRELTLSWNDVRSFEYDGKVHTVQATLLGSILSGDTVKLSYSDNGGNKNVGTYTVTASITNKNYILTGTVSCQYEITPKALTLTWGADRTFVYDGLLHTVRATANGVLSGDVVEISYSDNNGNKNAGTYTVTASITNKNYVLTGTLSCEYEIVQKELMLIWDGNRTFSYNGEKQSVTATLSGVASGDVVTIKYSDNGGNVDAGTYTVTASVANGNYVLTGETSCTYTITAKNVELAWYSANELVHDGSAKSFEAQVSGVIGDDDLQISYTYYLGGQALEGTPVEVGSYTVVAKIDNQNYTADSLTAEFSIVLPVQGE